ncbi:MAG: polysaccharide deacetylase family protein [Candidatus Omnitrophica bacterium]|nr:polysaccharide deacetylase family protein [Candidatus Omnitrophota bacterium]
MSRFACYPPILAYHRVGEFKGDHVPTVSTRTFERHLTFLARGRYRVVGLEEVIASLARGQRPARRSVAITFDDGYAETHEVAWPLLKRFGFPATVFVAPAEVGWPGFATWQQVAAMARDGLVIGCHTMHHSYLPLVNANRLPEELVESKRVIEERIGRSVTLLSYPVGGFTPQIQSAVQQAGYAAACTTNRASPHPGIDPYALRRIKVTERDGNPMLFWAKVSGYYDLFRRLREPA